MGNGKGILFAHGTWQAALGDGAHPSVPAAFPALPVTAEHMGEHFAESRT